MKVFKVVLAILVCQFWLAGCGPGAGDPDAPIENPPTLDPAGDNPLPADTK